MEELPAPVAAGCERFDLGSAMNPKHPSWGFVVPTPIEGSGVILHHRLSFRQPAYGRFAPIYPSMTPRLDGFHSPIHPVCHPVQGAFPISRTSAVTPDSIATPVAGVHRSVSAPVASVSELVVHRRAGPRWNLSTGDGVHGRRMDHVVKSLRDAR